MRAAFASRAIGLLVTGLAAEEAAVLAGAVLLEVPFALAVPAKHSGRALGGKITGVTGSATRPAMSVHTILGQILWHHRVYQRLPLPLSSVPVLGGALSTDLFLRRACMRQAPHLESRSRPRGRGLKTICLTAIISKSLQQATAAVFTRFALGKGDNLPVGIFAQRTFVGNR